LYCVRSAIHRKSHLRQSLLTCFPLQRLPGMPAIQPARLKIQTAALTEAVLTPAVFVRGLHDLLGFYANRAYRPGQAGSPKPLLQSYNAPPPVMRQLSAGLLPLCEQNPAGILSLCQALWGEPVLEFRLLAAQLSGQLPAENASQRLTLLRSWIATQPEVRLLYSILERATVRLRTENPPALLAQAASWLNETEAWCKIAGLQMIQCLVADPGFNNLPAVFPMLGPYVRLATTTVRAEVLLTIKALARRSPSETGHFLRENLTVPGNPDTPWMIRQVIDEFPTDIQSSLRAALKTRARG